MQITVGLFIPVKNNPRPEGCLADRKGKTE